MATPMMRIKKALEKEFSSKEIKLERTKGGRISGWVISESFENLAEVDRFQKIWKVLDKYLDPEDHSRVLSIFAMTPYERKTMDENWKNHRPVTPRYRGRKLAAFLARVRNVLEQEFAPREIELKRTPGGRVTGWITSKSFARQSETERVRRIWKLFDEHLTPEERDHVSFIWPLTPLERKVLLEEEE
jgi:acid stress-induced BolA-like protein IbaG/YrbA